MKGLLGESNGGSGLPAFAERLLRVGMLCAVAVAVVAFMAQPQPRAQAQVVPSVENDELTRKVTMTAGGLRMVFDYASGAKISSLSVNGIEKLSGVTEPSVSFARLGSNGGVLSSARTDRPPRVAVSGKRVTADFTMSNGPLSIQERWTFVVTRRNISHRIDRSYRWKKSAVGSERRLAHMGQPRMVWSRDAWDYIRKPEDGGTLPVGGEKLREAADARLPASEPADYAPILTPGRTLGQSFTAEEPFAKVAGKFPTYNTKDSDMTLSLYRGWPGERLELVGSKRFENVADNSWLYLEFAEPLPAGKYYLEQSEPEGTIAWWTNSTDYYPGGQAYADRQPTGEDRNIRIGDAAGPFAFPNGLALESGGNRYGAEQSDYTFLDRASRVALRVSADSKQVQASDHFRRGEVREPGALETNWLLSGESFTYTNGNPKGYVSPGAQHDEAGGHFSTGNSAFIFAPFEVGDRASHSVTLKWEAEPWEKYYDVGELRGIDEALLAGMINDFGRAIMQDKRIGGSSERSFRSAQAPPFTSIWNIYAAELLQDQNAFAAFREQMKDIRDGLQGPDGFVHCCYPYEPPRQTPPTYDITDNVVNWPLAVAELYNLDPNDPWLNDMKDSVRGALDYAVRELRVPEGNRAALISNYQCGHPAPDVGCEAEWAEWNDQYYIGQVSAYHNVMAYAALTRWAELEREVLGNTTKAEEYERIAAGIRRKYNQDGADGGFWSPETKTFAYTRDRDGKLVKDCSHLFANGYALKYGIVQGEDRRHQVASSLKRLYDERGWKLHGSNPVSCKTTEPHMFFPFFEDGGVHFLMEQPAAQIGLELGDRGYSVRFARNVVERYGWDNFWGFSNVQPDTMEVRRDVYQEPWMGNNVLGVWPLYHDIFGFQPHHDRLDILPYIDASVVGSTVEYDWRGKIPITVRYEDLETYSVTHDGPEPVRVGWRGRQPSAVYTVVDDGRSAKVRADERGIVWYELRGNGTSTLSIEG